MWWPGQRAPLNRTGQWGQSAPTTSGAQAECAPSRQSWLQDPRALIFVVFGVLLLVTAASAMPIRQERVHQQSNVPRGWRRSFWELCPPGYHVSEDGKNCTSCVHGVDFTIYWNVLPSCLPCTTCKSGEEEKTPCTATADTRCECKPGTFRDENSPEFCQKCRTRCPDGMVMATPCTPSSDLKCVDQKSGNLQLVFAIAVPCLVVVFVVVVIACCLCKYKVQGYGLDPKCMDKVLFWRSHPSRGPAAQDNKLMCGDSLSTLLTKKEQEDQEQDKLADVTVQSSGEAEHLLEPAAAEGSRVRRGPLVPADGEDPTECLRQCFDDFSTIVPYDAWDKLMRKMGLTQNEIRQSRDRAQITGDALYEMLETWVRCKGREASVNDLLDALAALGQRHAKEKIEDMLVGSRKFVFKEGEAGAAVS
ncbi:tumor necrosis factor receptor superfamily member 10A-like isoform X2 [Phacochoerus africanus]|uniref:tumor necrosis factor receptor superfamily member 10A-like isoform X2 n=1 Tax=Phacochoerus africanus TaxID=41426 RepID=UPI001FD8A797|nr:tumor necrosis factor receptor superfamily member 10A-like isoform X2 [Phacochoerus africanus]